MTASRYQPKQESDIDSHIYHDLPTEEPMAILMGPLESCQGQRIIRERFLDFTEERACVVRLATFLFCLTHKTITWLASPCQLQGPSIPHYEDKVIG
jgi:hypothetical protein